MKNDPDFELPQNGPALFTRYPKVVELLIRDFLCRQNRDISIEQFQDLVMDGWVHLFSKPLHGRKHNKPSIHRGIDRVAMFDPERIGGADSKRFFAYIKIVLYNWYCCTQYGSDAYDHVTVAIALDDEEDGGFQDRRLGDECIVTRRGIPVIQRLMLIEFLDYLQRTDRTIYEFVCIFCQTGTYWEAANELGIDPYEAANKMRGYAEAFQNK